MAKSEAWQRGDQVRRELIGPAAVEKMQQAGLYDDPLMTMFGDYAREAVFAGLWTRGGIDKKTRALICVISDTAIHALPELALHLRMARRLGWSEEELGESIMHLSGYVGLPAVREALLVAKKVFAEMRSEPGGGLE